MSELFSRPVQILLVEDSPGDVSLTREALRTAQAPNELSVVEDGDAALRFLRREGEHADAVTADLVLLDLNLPRRSGLEVLVDIKTDPALKHIPVIVLTTSSDEREILRSYQQHANAYVTKPVSLEDFLVALHQLEGFWLQAVQLPGAGGLAS